jgi:hypothetical protein
MPGGAEAEVPHQDGTVHFCLLDEKAAVEREAAEACAKRGRAEAVEDTRLLLRGGEERRV